MGILLQYIKKAYSMYLRGAIGLRVGVSGCALETHMEPI